MKKYIFAHPFLFFFVVLAGIIAQGSAIAVSVFTMHIVDALGTGEADALLALIPIMAGVAAFIGLTMIFHTRTMFLYGAKTELRLQKDLFGSLMGTKISDFNQENSGKYISVFNNDLGTITQNYFSSIIEAIKFLGSTIVAIVTMAVIHPVAGLMATSAALLVLLAPAIFSKKMMQAQTKISMKKIVFNQKIKDFLSGFEVIKSFGAEGKIVPKFNEVVEKTAKAKYEGGKAAGNLGAMTIFMLEVIIFANYLVAGFFVLRGDITVGGAVAIVGLSTGVAMPLRMFAELLGKIKSTKEINKRVLDMMKQTDTKVRGKTIKRLENGIVAQDLSFAYKEGAPVLKNVNYIFKKGGKYAIVGPSGSGKSTLTKLAMGYYDNYDGDLLINGHNIRDIDREGLYDNLSILHQNVFLLDDTLRNNITLYKDYSEAEYRNALEKANLLEVEARLAGGSDTVLGEGGNIISGGERQRIAIARAILKGSELMILDEATASLDNIIAHSIEKSIVDVDGLTCIFVTHRYSKDVLEKCDGILVMRNGELHEEGTFEELYARKGYFYSLYNTID